MRRRFSWTPFQVDKLNKVIEILEEHIEFLPLTLRQIYYQMVGNEYIENTRSQYISLSKLIKWARIDGHIPWDHIEDRVRAVHDLSGFNNSKDFINQEVRYFLEGYRRNRMQAQDRYIEIWIEKDALSSIFQKIARPYSISVIVCRGFASVSFLYGFKQRLEYWSDKDPLMLYFGDFDPSGKEMLPAMETTLIDEMDAPRIEFKRIALTPEQIEEYQLPHNPSALKRSDTRAQKHIEEYGYLAVELDALRPDTLTKIATEAIENEIDTVTYQDEIDIEKIERTQLKMKKEHILELLSKE
jgi:hypothetical protein